MGLNANRVVEIYRDSLFKEGEDTSGMILAEGVISKTGFHPDRLAKHADEIGEMLKELPDGFQAEGGGGQSFLNACMDKHGNHWAEQPTVDLLFQLGTATEKAQYCLPREMWPDLPGGMPYLVVF